MNRIGMMTLLAMGLASLDADALEARQSPYDAIARRNLFQLHGPPQTSLDAPATVVLRKATLTGIVTILEKPVAFITIERAKSSAEWVMLRNGERVNGIEVKSIDERAGVVRILNDGESQILDFQPAKASGWEPFQGSPKTLPSLPSATQSKAEDTLTSEQQTALIEFQRIKFQMAGDPASTLLPPTELSSNDKNSAVP